MAQSQRLRRVADQIQRELSALLFNELKDPRVGFITLTGVEVSPDLAHAKVYYTSMGDEQARAQTAEGLERASGFLRSLLGRRLQVHTTPELHFVFDESVERGAQLSQLIDRAVSGGKADGE
jgi:ribosome-binding factor A